MTTAADVTVESLENEVADQQAEILYLKEQIARLTRQIFGKKSERVVDVYYRREDRITNCPCSQKKETHFYRQRYNQAS